MLSRRQFLEAGALLVSPEVLAAAQHAHEMTRQGNRARLEFFDAKSAVEIESLAETILPEDDTPGARKAGVIYFIDRALVTFNRNQQYLYRKGLKSAEVVRKRLFPGSLSIERLSAEERIQLAQAIEKSEFFETLRMHTVMGFLAHPNWGGNQAEVGWKLIGFDNAMIFRPPFGYYDDPNNGYVK